MTPSRDVSRLDFILLRRKNINTQKFHPFVVCFVFNILLTTGASCQQQDYPNAYKDLMGAFKAEGVKLMSAPPPSKSLPKAKKRELFAQHIDDMSKCDQKYSDRIKALKPPKLFLEVNTATVAWLKVQAVDTHLWAESIRHSNHRVQNQVNRDGNIHQINALLHLKKALKKIGATSEKVDKLISELQQEIKKH